MNVSSVKNLNGETFSAVQDYELTNFVQTNSGSWTGDEFPVSADEAIQYVQTNSANIDDTVTSYQTNSGDYLKEVSHDNTLSGNGTVDSPLGVVPGYNETVLWTNNGTFSAKNSIATFNEPASAFERLMFVCGTDTHSKNCSVVEYHPGSASINWPGFYSNGFRYWQTTFNINDTGMTAGPGFICAWTYSTATNAWTKVNIDWKYNYQGIWKVIGINRKA